MEPVSALVESPHAGVAGIEREEEKRGETGETRRREKAKIENNREGEKEGRKEGRKEEGLWVLNRMVSLSVVIVWRRTTYSISVRSRIV